MGALDVIALIFILISLIKITFIIFNKKSWYENVTKKVYSNKFYMVIFLILAVIIFSYLMKQLTLVQIFSVVAFTSLVFAFGLMQYNTELLSFVKKVYDKKFNALQIAYVVVWVILLLLALYEIYFKYINNY